MNRRQREAIILSLTDSLRTNGSWCGETHLQKATYFLEELAKVPLELNFILYKHGPFSFGLRDELSSMQGDGLIQLRVQPRPYGPSFAPTDRGERLKQRWHKTVAAHRDQVDFVARGLGSRGVAELERLGTALYVSGKDASGDVCRRTARICELKAHISEEEAREAVEEVDHMTEEYSRLKSEG